MDPATLAATVVTSYLLPHVTKGAEELASSVASQVGEAAADFASGVASKLWQRVKSIFTTDDERLTLTEFERHPAAAQPLFELKLRQRLEADADLARQLEDMVSERGPGGQTGEQIFNNSGVLINLQNANLQRAHHFSIIGYQQGQAPDPPGNDQPPGSRPPSRS
jgi:hypothetical protein